MQNESQISGKTEIDSWKERALTSSSARRWSAYTTDLLRLSGRLAFDNLSLALALKERRKSKTIKT